MPKECFLGLLGKVVCPPSVLGTDLSRFPVWKSALARKLFPNVLEWVDQRRVNSTERTPLCVGRGSAEII